MSIVLTAMMEVSQQSSEAENDASTIMNDEVTPFQGSANILSPPQPAPVNLFDGAAIAPHLPQIPHGTPVVSSPPFDDGMTVSTLQNHMADEDVSASPPPPWLLETDCAICVVCECDNPMPR